MPVLDQLFSEAHLTALAAMLFHSLWQGALLAAAAGIMLMLTKKSSASFRYNFLITLLIMFAAGSVYTYLSHLPGISDNNIPGTSLDTLGQQIAVGNQLPEENIAGTAIRFFHNHASWIVTAWLMLMLIRLFLILSGYYSVHRFARKELSSPPEQWQKRWETLAADMKVQMPVRLMESAIAKVPMVLGHLRPLVLVPVGMLMSLPPHQAEAILLHELAHIKRRDYLMNLVQQAIESIFFFHPAVSWVSSLISEERENCCDDMASSCNKDIRSYINALVTFYEKALPPSIAIGFGGRRNSIVNRIKRLIHHRNKTLNIMEKIFLTAGIIITGFLVQAFQYNIKPAIYPHNMQQTDTVPGKKTEMNMTENNKNYRFIYRNGQLSELYVDGQKIAPEKHTDFRKVEERMQETHARAQKEATRAMAEAEDAHNAAKEALDEAEKELARANRELSTKKNDHKNLNENEQEIIDEKEIEKIVRNALQEAEKTLRELNKDGKTGKAIMQEIQQAFKEAQLEMKESQKRMKESQKEMKEGQKEMQKNQQEMEMDEQGITALTGEAVELALKAAHLGLRQANIELEMEMKQDENEKMSREEYRERKKDCAKNTKIISSSTLSRRFK